MIALPMLDATDLVSHPPTKKMVGFLAPNKFPREACDSIEQKTIAASQRDWGYAFSFLVCSDWSMVLPRRYSHCCPQFFRPLDQKISCRAI